MTNIYLIIAVVVLVLLSAFFSGTETGMYRMSYFRLRLGLEQRRGLLGILDKLTADSPGVIFSTLIGATLAESLASGVVVYIFLSGHYTAAGAEFYTTLLMTPILFVFAELIPKNVYFYTGDWLMLRLSPLIFVFHRIFVLCGAVGFLKLLSRLFARIAGIPADAEQIAAAAQRHPIRQLIQEAQEEEALSLVQTQIMERLANMPKVRLSGVMTPLGRVRMLPAGTARTELLNVIKEMPHRRLPVYEKVKTDIRGYVDIYEILGTSDDFATMEGFMKPLSPLNAEMPVIEALNTMRNSHLEIAMVARFDRHARPLPLGIVTMKDLVEELVGELAEW